MNPNTFVEGLIVSAIGIVVIFIAAAIFYLVIVALLKIFPPKAEEEEEAEGEEAAVSVAEAVAEVPDQSDELETVAAIAVAVNYARAHAQSNLGESLQEGRSAWWSANLLSARNNSNR